MINRKELREIIENCGQAIERNDGYTSADATLEILQAVNEYCDKPK